MASATGVNAEQRRKQVMVGELPEDFLRISRSSSQQQISADEQAAMLLQQQMAGSFFPSNAVGKLQVTVVEAKLTKNYGMTRMDPYVRIRVGHMVYETNTDHNGAKNPRWNKIVNCYLPQGVNTLSIELFDECAFTMDEKIAWCQITIPDRVLTENETHVDWYPLSGKQGDEREGSINLVFSYSPAAGHPSPVYAPQYFMVPAHAYGSPAPMYPGAAVTYTGGQMQPQPMPRQQIQNRPISEEDLKQVKEMFPNVEMEVVKSIMESNGGNKDATINALLSMST